MIELGKKYAFVDSEGECFEGMIVKDINNDDIYKYGLIDINKGIIIDFYTDFYYIIEKHMINTIKKTIRITSKFLEELYKLEFKIHTTENEYMLYEIISIDGVDNKHTEFKYLINKEEMKKIENFLKLLNKEIKYI